MIRNNLLLRLTKQIFIALLSLSESSTTKCVPLNNGPFIARPTLVDLNLAEFNYCPGIISLDECSGSRNAVDA